MSFGLRVWDAYGNVTIDNVDRLSRVSSSVYVPSIAYNSTVVVSVPGYALDGTWFYAPVAIPYFVRATAGWGQISITNVAGGGYATPAFNIIIIRG
jgi:hypothetical protein